jgi:hypothetical protein
MVICSGTHVMPPRRVIDTHRDERSNCTEGVTALESHSHRKKCRRSEIVSTFILWGYSGEAHLVKKPVLTEKRIYEKADRCAGQISDIGTSRIPPSYKIQNKTKVQMKKKVRCTNLFIIVSDLINCIEKGNRRQF